MKTLRLTVSLLALAAAAPLSAHEAHGCVDDSCSMLMLFDGEAAGGSAAAMTIEAPKSMLLQILAAWPEPGPPAWITALPIWSRKARARSNACGSPPTMKVSVPPSAAAIPPETGASTIL